MMRSRLTTIALVLAGLAPLPGMIAPASADPINPCQVVEPCDPMPQPFPLLEGWGFCSLYRSTPGTSSCSVTYMAASPFGELTLSEFGADARVTAKCTVGSAMLDESGTTTFAHAGKCAVFLTTFTAGAAAARLQSVLTPQ